MLFYVTKHRYRNIKIVINGKDICKFTNGKLETKDKKIINLLKNKDKYPFVYFDEEEKEIKEIEDKKDKPIEGLSTRN